MKHIGVDCRFAGLNSGLGRYTREVVTHLLKRRDNVSYTLFVRSEGEAWLKTLPKEGFVITQAPYPHYSLHEQFLFPALLRSSNLDLLFAPHFNVPLFCPIPFVVVIHDLILHRYPNQASVLKRLAYRFLMRHAVKSARSIIAVSHFTASELLATYGNAVAKKTVTVGEGIAPSFQLMETKAAQAVCTKYDLKKPFFLYVGNAKEHKNVQCLIDAFEALKSDSTELVLVTHGKEVERLHRREGVRTLPQVTDEDLPALYSSAKAFLTASRYEGYCLPVLEARACGCPVIASRGGAIPEIVGERGVLVEPNREAFAHAMQHVPERSTKPPEDLPTWDRSAEEISAILLRDGQRF